MIEFAKLVCRVYEHLGIVRTIWKQQRSVAYFVAFYHYIPYTSGLNDAYHSYIMVVVILLLQRFV